MKWIYRHPALYDVVDSLCSFSLADRVRRRVIRKVDMDSLLEIGAGSGKNLAMLDCGLRIALDRSPRMLEYARKRFPGIFPVVGDAHMLPFRDACVKVSLFSYCLRGLSSPFDAVKEAMRVSREVIIIDYGRPRRMPRAIWEKVLNRMGSAVFGSKDVDYGALTRLSSRSRMVDSHGGLYKIIVLKGAADAQS
jgi:ubiquinone/menaquinone biosynthesis C-methylase UbiE